MQLVDDGMTEEWSYIKRRIASLYPELDEKVVVYAVNKASQLLRKARCDIYDLRFSNKPFDYDERDFNETIDVSGKRIYMNASSD